jgi:hypothetical protein
MYWIVLSNNFVISKIKIPELPPQVKLIAVLKKVKNIFAKITLTYSLSVFCIAWVVVVVL